LYQAILTLPREKITAKSSLPDIFSSTYFVESISEQNGINIIHLRGHHGEYSK